MRGTTRQPHGTMLAALLLAMALLSPPPLAAREGAAQPDTATAESAAQPDAEAPPEKAAPAEDAQPAEQPAASAAREGEEQPATGKKDGPAPAAPEQQTPPAEKAPPAKKAPPRPTVAGALDACIGAQESLGKRLARLQTQWKKRRQEQKRALMECRRHLADLRHRGERNANVWKQVVERAVRNWIAANASNRTLGLRKCERFEEPRLVVEDGAPVLLLSGRVAEPAKIERRFRRLQQLLPGLRIDAETLRGLVDECSVEVAGVTVEEGSTIPVRDFESLNPDDLAGLPGAEACVSGALGRELGEKVNDGSVRIPGAWPADIWVNAGGDFGLCTHDEAGWYVRRSGLEGFAGLYLKGANRP